MIDIEDVIKEVSKRTKIDRELVALVCKNAFKFTVDVMKDEEDYHDILFNDLLRFKLKGRFRDDKTKPYSPKTKLQ